MGVPKYFSLGDVTADQINWDITLYRTGASAGYGPYTVHFAETGYKVDSNIPSAINPMSQ
jgi:hypothetical protein